MAKRFLYPLIPGIVGILFLAVSKGKPWVSYDMIFGIAILYLVGALWIGIVTAKATFQQMRESSKGGRIFFSVFAGAVVAAAYLFLFHGGCTALTRMKVL